jgi:hypothetical protein
MLNQFLYGAACMASMAIALFFFQFWNRSRDRLFVLFGFAFVILAFERVVLAAIHAQNEFVPYVFVIRLLAFLVIMVAIVDKNRRS